MAIVFVGIDLAKNVFAIHGVGEHGKPELIKPKVIRGHLSETIAMLPRCTIGMEACSGAHYWAREFERFGHTVKLIAPKFVTPYRMSGKRGKNDAADAAAICEAVQRPNMRFVPSKSEEQQGKLMVHRVRQGFVAQRTETINRLRGLLSDMGIVLPQKAQTVRDQAPQLTDTLTGWVKTVVQTLLDELSHFDQQIDQYDRHIKEIGQQDERVRQLMQLPGVGITTATALVAMVGNGHEFHNGRQFSAWLGLVPGQYSSGGKSRLGSITKAGDAYMRGLLLMGARAVLHAAAQKQDRMSVWAKDVEKRRGYWRAAVAVAAKNARMAWAILRLGDQFVMPA